MTPTKCQGCGITLQAVDERKPGYTTNLLKRLCKSCYQLLHYGVSSEEMLPADMPVLERDAIVFMISSVLHLDLLFSYPIHRHQGNMKYVYIINQIDLLPQSTNLDYLMEHILVLAKEHHIPYHDIIMMSAKNSRDIQQLKTYIQGFNEKNMYLLGVQNSGKTTLFKALTNNQEALAIKKAGLTKEALKGNFLNKIIFDMPGLFQKGYLHTFMPYHDYKLLIPDKEIKPKIFQQANKGFVIENFIFMTLETASSTVFYLSQLCNLKQVNFDKTWTLNDDANFVKTTFKKQVGLYQITFADMGFVHVRAPFVVTLKHPKQMHISITEALFK